MVLSLLLETAGSVRGSAPTMARRLEETAAWCARSLADQCDRLSGLAGQAAESGYPPLHHSAVYVAAYRPAYRVVRSDLVKGLGTGD